MKTQILEEMVYSEIEAGNDYDTIVMSREISDLEAEWVETNFDRISGEVDAEREQELLGMEETWASLQPGYF